MKGLNYEVQKNTVWIYMHTKEKTCFSPKLINSLKDISEKIMTEEDFSSIEYAVLASKVPGLYNVGGDLEVFRRLIQSNDRAGLQEYAHACVDLLYGNLSGFGRGVTTIALVQGNALGGGFESALSCNLLIAEKGVKMGFPEILFNLFPGMGAYNILYRKLTPHSAEKMILSGSLYRAEQLHEMGIVDVLAEKGDGRRIVREYINKESKSRNGVSALRQAMRVCNPISRDELIRVAEIWVDAALRLQEKDLRMITRLISRQQKKQEGYSYDRVESRI